ncbi:MAG: D-tyrosyl-tRNA(Tyr) deacylase [Deltaproteobacteria bacterium]|nr:D-tyrosyl-tRNA(Tyr) deacylase [Deltaproteobacteria bacterium]
MRIVVQRVKKASVAVDGATKGEINKGLLVYAGVQKGDNASDIEYIASKLLGLRIFEDAEGKMNLDILQTGGEVLLISQFTLQGDCRKGRRPSFDQAETPEAARLLYEGLVKRLRESVRVATGEFQSHMEVESINDGPVTMLLDSKKLF